MEVLFFNNDDDDEELMFIKITEQKQFSFDSC